MKYQRKLSLLPKAILITLLLITACSKDDEVAVPPSISIIEETGYVSGDTMIAAGGEIHLKVLLEKGDQNITNFIIDVYGNDLQTYFDTGMNTSYLLWEGKFIKTFAPEEEWKFTVRDRDGNYSVTSLNIGLDTISNYHPLNTISALDLGAQDNLQAQGLFASSDYNTYFHHQAASDTSIQAEVDMLYFYSEEDKNTIASPGANIEDGIFAINPADWTIINTTRYFKTTLTVDDFSCAHNDSIILANYEEGEAKRKAKKLQEYEIYTFRTHSGKLGMFMVSEVVGTTEGLINIDLKIQQ